MPGWLGARRYRLDANVVPETPIPFPFMSLYELDAADPLVRMDQVLCTPHLGYVEWSTYETYYGAAVDNVLAFAAGRPANVINPQALRG